ncbi:MAG: FAD-binding protein [Gammaproteobacteria bacterium]
MTKRYDLAIVGAGTAAMVAAMRARTAGRSVAIIDFRPFGVACGKPGGGRP